MVEVPILLLDIHRFSVVCDSFPGVRLLKGEAARAEQEEDACEKVSRYRRWPITAAYHLGIV